MAEPVKRSRKNQPQCGSCRHSISFHGSGTTKCRALGCHCEVWVEPAEAAVVEPSGDAL